MLESRDCDEGLLASKFCAEEKKNETRKKRDAMINDKSYTFYCLILKK